MSTTIPLPQEVADLDLAFGARALDLMPPMAEIPAVFQWCIEGICRDVRGAVA